MHPESIKFEKHGQVGLVSIHRPETRNAFTYPMLMQLFEAFDYMAGRDDIKAAVLYGEGGSFSSGTDVKYLAQIPASERGITKRIPKPGRRWELCSFPKPLVAAIDGPAVGLGAEFTSHCDVRLASTRATFSWNFVKRGLVPDTGAGTWLLPRLVGVQNALRLLYTGETITAERALEIGYVMAVTTVDDVLGSSLEYARELSSGPMDTTSMIKDLVYESLSRRLPEHLAESDVALQTAFQSQDHAEGVRAFIEKREPQFNADQ